MPEQVIVVDSNQIIASSFHLDTPWWTMLLGSARGGNARVVVPEVVLIESLGKLRRELATINKQLRSLGVAVIDEGAVITECNNRLRSWLVDCDIPDVPSDRLNDLVNRAVDRMPPFNESGNGFRDSTIWLHVMDEVESGHLVSLISNDNGFADKAADHRVLKLALARESRNQVSWFASIADWARAQHDEGASPDVYAEVITLVRAEEQQIKRNIFYALRHTSLWVEGGPEIQGFVPLVGESPLRVVSVSPVPGGNTTDVYVVSFAFDATLSIILAWPTRDYAQRAHDACVTVTGSFLFDQAEQELDNILLEPIEIDSQQLGDGRDRLF